MSLYEQNLSYMKDNLPLLYDYYIKKKKDYTADKKIEICDTNGSKNIRLNGKLIHSKYNPEIDGKLMSMALENEDFDTIFIMGLGMGYHLEEIIENFKDKNKIIYEPNLAVFDEYLNSFEIQKLHQKNVIFMVEDEKEHIAEGIIDIFMAFKIYRVTFIGLPTYIVEYMDQWRYITDTFIGFFRRYSVNVKTVRLYRDAWIQNYFKNLKHYPYEADVDEFVGKFRGVPGVIVSSGPSLTKNVNLLKEITDKAVIVAAGSSVNAMEKHGISPHIMLGVDGSQLMSDEYNAVSDKSIIFSHIMNVHYDCIDKYPGPKMHLRVSSEPHIDYFEKLNDIKTTQLHTGGSCANVAMDFLRKLGCDPIILIGQDLAFPGNVTHAEGVWDRKEVNTEEAGDYSSGLLLTKDVYGNDVYTNRSFEAFRKWFEEYIIEMKNLGEDIHVINATEGGAFINGAQHTTLRAVIDQYCTEGRDIRARLEALYDSSLENADNNKVYIKKFLDTSEKELAKLEKWSRERTKLILRILKQKNKRDAKTRELREKINKLTSKMEKSDAYFHFIWQPLHELIYNIKNHYEQKALAESNVDKKLEYLYEGLEQQFAEIHRRILLIKAIIGETREQIKGWYE